MSLLKNSNGQPLGYIFNFSGHGAFAPSGKVDFSTSDGKIDLSPEEIKAHNSELERLELLTMTQTGKGLLYLVSDKDGRNVIQQWAGKVVAYPQTLRKSWHNMAGKNGRTDVSFSFAGFRWHGVNIGDNQILRCKACKK